MILSGFRAALRQLEQRLSARLWVRRLDSDELATHLHRCVTGLSHPVRAPEHGAYLNAVLASQEFVGGFAPRVGNLHLRLVAIAGYPGKAPVGPEHPSVPLPLVQPLHPGRTAHGHEDDPAAPAAVVHGAEGRRQLPPGDGEQGR